VSALELGLPRRAQADVITCINAHAAGQRELKSGRFKAATELFTSCATSPSCPDAIRVECVEFRQAVEKSIPTVVFSVIDERGNDVPNVRVYAAKELIAARLDGRAVALDPGKYELRFVLADGAVINNEVVVREGEKNRVITVHTGPQDGTLGPLAPPSNTLSTRAAVPVAELTSSPDASQRRLPIAFWVSAGVGTVALGSWSTFALLGHHRQTELNECSPHCETSRHSDFNAMRRDYLIADLSLGVAVASAGLAAWFYFSGATPAVSEGGTRSPVSFSVQPTFSARGANLVLTTYTP
jgi:hypothetical protein